MLLAQMRSYYLTSGCFKPCTCFVRTNELSFVDMLLGYQGHEFSFLDMLLGYHRQMSYLSLTCCWDTKDRWVIFLDMLLGYQGQMSYLSWHINFLDMLLGYQRQMSYLSWHVVIKPVSLNTLTTNTLHVTNSCHIIQGSRHTMISYLFGLYAIPNNIAPYYVTDQ